MCIRDSSSGPVARSTQSVVTFTARAGAAQAMAGGDTTLEIQADIKPGWHINSATPPLDYLIPTSVSLPAGADFSLVRIDYPEGRTVKLGFAGKPVSVYEGARSIRVTLRLAAETRPGLLKASGSVTFQACNDESCLAPIQKSFEVDLQVAAPPPRG